MADMALLHQVAMAQCPMIIISIDGSFKFTVKSLTSQVMRGAHVSVRVR